MMDQSCHVQFENEQSFNLLQIQRRICAVTEPEYITNRNQSINTNFSRSAGTQTPNKIYTEF